MGWTFFERTESVKEWFEDYLAFETDKVRHTVLASSVRLTEGYAAVEVVDKVTNERTVFAAVFLFRHIKDVYNFGYKPMTEEMGPNASRCPTRILGHLTPTESEWANQWRERCRKYNSRPKIRIGDTVVFDQPIVGYTKFTKVKHGRKRNIYRAHGGPLYRLGADFFADPDTYKVIRE
jgi:hypothetical protein